MLRETSPEFDSGAIETVNAGMNPSGEDQGFEFTLIDSLSEQVTEPAWLWRGFVAREALTVIGGRPKVGKSTLLFALLAAVRSGRPFLEWDTERVGAVLLSEERPQTISMKARSLGLANSIPAAPIPIGRERIERPPVYVVTRHDAVGVSWPDVVSRATAFAVGHGLGLLVVDTWNAWASLGGEDENQAGAVLKAVSPLGEAAAAGLAVVLVAHQRKGGGEHGEALRGSSALAGAVDVVVELERLKGEDRSARIVRSVSRFPTTPDELVFRFTDQATFETFDPAEASAAAERGRVLEALRELGRSTADDVADSCDMSTRKARRILSELVGYGVERYGEGVKGDPHTFEVAA